MTRMASIGRQLCLALWVGAGACLAGPAQASDANESMYLEALRFITENRPEEAKTMLMTLIEKEPQHAGAWLDLAIVQCALENREEANRLFRVMIERFAPPPPILEIIAIQQAQGCFVHAPEKHVSVLFERGFDSNVNQGPSNGNFSLDSGSTHLDLQLLPEFLPKADNFSAVSMNGARALTSSGMTGFAQLRVRHNDTLSALNTIVVAAGIDRPWRLHDWGGRATGMLSLLTLGAHLYQKQGVIQVRVIPPLVLPNNMQFSVTGGLSKVQYPTLFNYDAKTWELRSLLSYHAARFDAQGGAAYLSDRADGARQGGNRQGWAGNATIRGKVFRDYEAELGWSRQRWQSESAYSPGLVDQARHQDTQAAKAALIWPIRKMQTIALEFRAIANRENISILQYNSKSIQLSWQWQNF